MQPLPDEILFVPLPAGRLKPEHLVSHSVAPRGTSAGPKGGGQGPSFLRSVTHCKRPSVFGERLSERQGRNDAFHGSVSKLGRKPVVAGFKADFSVGETPMVKRRRRSDRALNLETCAGFSHVAGHSPRPGSSGRRVRELGRFPPASGSQIASRRYASGLTAALARAPRDRQKHRFLGNEEWCLGADSNHRHVDFQSTALPTELPRRAFFVAGAGSISEPIRGGKRV